MITPVLVFKKIESNGQKKCDTFYSHSKAVTIINESNIDDVFQLVNYIKHTKILRKRFRLDY